MNEFEIRPPGLIENLYTFLSMLFPGKHPLYAQLSVSDDCNLACLGCRSNTKYGQRIELSYDELRLAILYLRRLRVRILSITGGEPFKIPWLPELIAIARDHHSPYSTIPLVTVNTNGLPLLKMPPNEFLPFIERLAKSGLSNLNFSVDRLHWPRYEKRKCQANAVLLMAQKIVKYRIPTSISWVLTRNDDIGEIQNTVLQALSSGIQFNLQLYSSVGGEFSSRNDHLVPTINQIQILARWLLTLKRKQYIAPFGTVTNSYHELRWMEESFNPKRPWRCIDAKQSTISIKPAIKSLSEKFSIGFCQEYSVLTSNGRFNGEMYHQLCNSQASQQLRQHCRGCFYTCYIRIDRRFMSFVDLADLGAWLIQGLNMRDDALVRLVRKVLL